MKILKEKIIDNLKEYDDNSYIRNNNDGLVNISLHSESFVCDFLTDYIALINNKIKSDTSFVYNYNKNKEASIHFQILSSKNTNLHDVNSLITQYKREQYEMISESFFMLFITDGVVEWIEKFKIKSFVINEISKNEPFVIKEIKVYQDNIENNVFEALYLLIDYVSICLIKEIDRVLTQEQIDFSYLKHEC